MGGVAVGVGGLAETDRSQVTDVPGVAMASDRGEGGGVVYWLVGGMPRRSSVGGQGWEVKGGRMHKGKGSSCVKDFAVEREICK